MLKPRLNIRQATGEDIPAMRALLTCLFALEPDFAVDAKRQTLGLSMLLDDCERSTAFVAEEDGKVVGMCSAQLTVSTAQGGYSALIEDVVVDKGRRGRGVGRALMDAARSWSQARGATRMQLLADRDNAPALSFYAKLGWSGTRMICLRAMV